MQATEKKLGNNKIWLTVLSVGVVIAIILGIVGLVNHGDTKANTIPTINQQVDNIKNTLPELEAVSTELKGYIDTLETTVEKLQTDITATNTAIDTLETEVYGKVDAEKTATLNQLKADKAELESKITAANKAIEDAKAANTASEKAITDQITALEAELEKADADNKSAIEARIAALQTALEKADADNKAAIEAQIEILKAELEAADAADKKAIEDRITALQTALEKADSDNKAAIEAQISALSEELKKADADNRSAIEAQITALQTALEKADADNKAAIEAQIATLKTELEAADAANKKAIEEKIEKLNTDLSALIKANADSITALQTTAADLQTQINTVNTNVTNIKTELDSKIAASEKKVLDELNTLKTELEDQIATFNADINVLKAKDAELDQKIADLQTYVDSEITATKDWASATFSTLEQYEATQTAISEINALIKSTQESITALEEKLGKKIADDIAAAVAGVNADIAAKVTEITDAYTAAIADATDAITAAYTDAIKTAITASETSMKAWVNGVLADGYYTKAEIDGKITALQTQVAEGDENLQKEIDALEEALAKAESDLTAAYEKAIEDAITENNGKISAEIAAAVKTAQDNLQTQIAAINDEIEKIKARLDIIEADINTINQQITAIKASIEDLKGVDAELKGYIESLEATAADLRSKIDAANDALAALESDLEGQISASEQKVLNELQTVKTALEGQLATINNTIATLQAKDAELGQKIADLQTYVDSEITATKDWASATFSTLEQYEATQTAISEINALIKSTQESLTALEEKLGKKIADDIAAAVAGVNADIAAKVTEITDAYTAAIADATDAITAAYTDAIKTAITASETSMQNWVNEQLQNPLADIAELKAALNELKNNAATDEELAAAVANQQAALEKAKNDLTEAYKKAIEAAVADGGVINQAIASAVQEAQNTLQSKIDKINDELTDIKDRLTKLETNFANRIQSLIFVPQYSDGKIKMDYGTRKAQAHFRISPAEIAKLITADNVKAFARYTNDPTTRASYEPEFPLAVTSASGDETGMLEVNIAESSEKPLSTDYWLGQVEAIIYIQITDDNGNNVVSEAIPMIAHGYVANTNSINGYSDGANVSGNL